MELLVKNLANLFKVKTIVTLMLTLALTIGFLSDTVPIEVFAPFVMAIITFYFTKAVDKE